MQRAVARRPNAGNAGASFGVHLDAAGGGTTGLRQAMAGSQADADKYGVDLDRVFAGDDAERFRAA